MFFGRGLALIGTTAVHFASMTKKVFFRPRKRISSGGQRRETDARPRAIALSAIAAQITSLMHGEPIDTRRGYIIRGYMTATDVNRSERSRGQNGASKPAGAVTSRRFTLGRCGRRLDRCALLVNCCDRSAANPVSVASSCKRQDSHGKRSEVIAPAARSDAR